MSNDNYATPKWVLEIFEGFFDPCPLMEVPDTDGLSIEWGNRTFANPPYSETEKWVAKAIEENKKGKFVILLVRMDTSTKWFRSLMAHGAHFWISWDRLHFAGRAPFPSLIAILNTADKGSI